MFLSNHFRNGEGQGRKDVELCTDPTDVEVKPGPSVPWIESLPPPLSKSVEPQVSYHTGDMVEALRRYT